MDFPTDPYFMGTEDAGWGGVGDKNLNPSYNSRGRVVLDPVKDTDV